MFLEVIFIQINICVALNALKMLEQFLLIVGRDERSTALSRYRLSAEC